MSFNQGERTENGLTAENSGNKKESYKWKEHCKRPILKNLLTLHHRERKRTKKN